MRSFGKRPKNRKTLDSCPLTCVNSHVLTRYIHHSIPFPFCRLSCPCYLALLCLLWFSSLSPLSFLYFQPRTDTLLAPFSSSLCMIVDHPRISSNLFSLTTHDHFLSLVIYLFLYKKTDVDLERVGVMVKADHEYSSENRNLMLLCMRMLSDPQDVNNIEYRLVSYRSPRHPLSLIVNLRQEPHHTIVQHLIVALRPARARAKRHPSSALRPLQNTQPVDI